MSNLLILVEPYKIPDIECLCPKKTAIAYDSTKYVTVALIIKHPL